jgi:hypothetical protein
MPKRLSVLLYLFTELQIFNLQRWKSYASSYAGPVDINPKAPKGKVVEIDTVSFYST